MTEKGQHSINLYRDVGNKDHFPAIIISSSDLTLWDLRLDDSHILNVYKLKQFKEIHTILMV